MVKQEYTGKRDLSYNLWHRTIGDSYYMIDLDCVEWRSNRGVVAILERSLDMQSGALEQIIEEKRFELTVYSQVARKLEVPAYLVFYNEGLTTFKVFMIQNENAKFWKTMNDIEYTNFIKGL
jgi:hypothetical protein